MDDNKKLQRNFANFLAGAKILAERQSPINGKIQVVKSLGLGTYIQVEGLTQSGGVVESIWRKTTRRVKGKGQEVKNCLILGLGGGSAAKVMRKYYPKAKITGVEIDPVMVELGRKYLGLGQVQVKVQVQDAFKFVKDHPQSAISYRFDLILVDLYVGYEVPEKFQTERFSRLVYGLMAKNGVAVFNRLYFGEKRGEALRFAKKLEKVFSKVDYFYPEANLMLICNP